MELEVAEIASVFLSGGLFAYIIFGLSVFAINIAIRGFKKRGRSALLFAAVVGVMVIVSVVFAVIGYNDVFVEPTTGAYMNDANEVITPDGSRSNVVANGFAILGVFNIVPALLGMVVLVKGLKTGSR